MTSVSKNVYTDKLYDILDKYHNIYHRAIKMKPIDINSSTYVGFAVENNNKDPKFEVGERARVSKYKDIFAKGYIPNWSAEIFVIKKLAILYFGHL